MRGKFPPPAAPQGLRRAQVKSKALRLGHRLSRKELAAVNHVLAVHQQPPAVGPAFVGQLLRVGKPLTDDSMATLRQLETALGGVT